MRLLTGLDVEMCGNFTPLSFYELNSGDVLRMCSTDRHLPKRGNFRSAEEVRVAIQTAVNDQKNLEDYDAAHRFLFEETTSRIDRLVGEIGNPNTEFKEPSTIPLYFRTCSGPREFVKVDADIGDSIRALKMRLFALTSIEMNKMRLYHKGSINSTPLANSDCFAGVELTDDSLVSELPPYEILDLNYKAQAVIREAREHDTIDSCFEELVGMSNDKDALMCDMEVDLLRRLNELRPRLQLLHSLAEKMTELEATEPADFRVHVLDVDEEARDSVTVGAKADEPLFVFKFRLANAMKGLKGDWWLFQDGESLRSE